METTYLENYPMRRGMYLAYEILKTVQPSATDRFDARFRGLWAYARFTREDEITRLAESPGDYADFSRIEGGRIPQELITLLVDALFTDFLGLHRQDHTPEFTNRLCKDNLAAFLKKYFPGLDQRRSEFRKLQQVCRELNDEAETFSRDRQEDFAQAPAGEGPLLDSRSPRWRELIDIADRAARSRAPILLTGESGTGKEVLARFIHRQSPRSAAPFVAFNCGAMPEHLLESELFGYKKGAFTGADRNKPGLVAGAHGGTLFLDEIGEMSPRLQARLLRFLQEREFLPIGETKPVRVDVRVLAATNLEMEEALALGEFRRDLYYRLNVFRLDLPPLRARKEDIPELARHFIGRYNRENETRVRDIQEEALEFMAAYDWPGNVRELENAIHRAVVLAGEGLIGIGHLPDEVAPTKTVPPPNLPNRIRIDREALHSAMARALRRDPGANGRPRRLGQSVPLEQIIEFLAQTGGRPFPPRNFADFISPPGRPTRRDKLSNQILSAFKKNGLVLHNGASAQAARYRLSPAYMRTDPQ